MTASVKCVQCKCRYPESTARVADIPKYSVFTPIGESEAVVFRVGDKRAMVCPPCSIEGSGRKWTKA